MLCLSLVLPPRLALMAPAGQRHVLAQAKMNSDNTLCSIISTAPTLPWSECSTYGPTLYNSLSNSSVGLRT